MLALLLKVVFSMVTSVSNLVTQLIFNAAAYSLVVIIQAFKVPGDTLQGGLEKIQDAIKSCFEYFLEMIIELTGMLISSGFDLFVGVVTSLASVSGEAFGGLVEKMRTSFQELLTDVPEIAEGFWEMVMTMVTDFWNNCMQAMEHLSGNA